ncbi:hypothetical protein C3492_28375 [Streptomyces sp. Ru62]|nr:hypothetical protein C3492_28375 [Streptomyces sp. Ru62]
MNLCALWAEAVYEAGGSVARPARSPWSRAVSPARTPCATGNPPTGGPGRPGRAVDTACAPVAAGVWYTWGGGHGAQPGPHRPPPRRRNDGGGPPVRHQVMVSDTRGRPGRPAYRPAPTDVRGS